MSSIETSILIVVIRLKKRIRMELLIGSLICAAVVDANLMGGSTQVNPAHLENKLFNGKAAYRGEHKYIASVQLNGSHICSSGVFQMGFLLTTVECAWHLGIAIKKNERRATVVFANPILKDGQRINILKIAYCFRYNNYENDVGVIMLVNNYDQTHLEVLNSYPNKIDLRRHGPEASVCGWATNGPVDNVEFQDAKFSDNLNCMPIKLYGEGPCYKNIPFGDYKRKLMCGMSDCPKHLETVGDLGSPLTKIVYNDEEDENVILGVTIRSHIQGNKIFHRFIRITLVFDDIQEMIKQLQSNAETDEASVKKYQDLIKESG